MRAGARREPAFENQLVEKGARVEVFGRRQILERARNFPARRFGTAGGWLGHGAETLALVTRSTNLKIQLSHYKFETKHQLLFSVSDNGEKVPTS